MSYSTDLFQIAVHFVEKLTMTSNAGDDSDIDESTNGESLLSRLFDSCSDDPKGSVHRAWGVSLIFLVVYFVLAIVESKLALFVLQ